MSDQSQLGYSTLADVVGNYSSMDARAQYVQPAKVLQRACPLLQFLPMVASNNVLSNIATRTDYLPTPGTRRFNEGAPFTTSKNTPLSDPISMFVDYCVADKELVKIQNDPAAWMADQIDNHVEGFQQKLESELLYGNLAMDPGGFNGLATRFNNLESYPNGDQTWVPNVWNGGATGNATSIWAFEFGKDKVYGIYPPNSPAGLEIQTLGEQTWNLPTATSGILAQGKAIQAYVTYLQWKIGIQVADERCVQRIANVNPTALSSPGGFDENLLIQALGYLPHAGNAPGTVIVVNRAVLNEMNIRAVSQKTNGYYTQNMETGDIWGSRRITRFQGIEVVMCEKLSNTETIVS